MRNTSNSTSSVDDYAAATHDPTNNDQRTTNTNTEPDILFCQSLALANLYKRLGVTSHEAPQNGHSQETTGEVIYPLPPLSFLKASE